MQYRERYMYKDGEKQDGAETGKEHVGEFPQICLEHIELGTKRALHDFAYIHW